MCWIGYNVPQIAQEDIKAFKVGFRLESTGELVSGYHGFKYELKKRHDMEIGLREISSEWASINEAFHSYNAEKCEIVLSEKESCAAYNLYNVYSRKRGERLDYWFSTDESPLCDTRLVRMDCIIPKGSEYYENVEGEIASNSIIVEGFEYLD